MKLNLKSILQFLRNYFRPVWEHRWIGKSGLIAAGVVLVGRGGMEYFRDLPHFDQQGMDAYNTAERFRLRTNVKRGTVRPIEGASLGSSVSIWGVIPEIYEEELGLTEGSFVNCAVQGGVVFHGLSMVRRNEELFSNAKVVLIEANPQAMSRGMDDDDRIQLSVSQHATLSERLMIAVPDARRRQRLDFFLPFWSSRRSFDNLVRNIADPQPLEPLLSYTGGRLGPYSDWKMDGKDLSTYEARLKVTPERAAELIMGNWRPSKLQDHSIRQTLDRLRAQGAIIILHQFPTHPLAVEAIRKDKDHTASLKRYDEYVRSLGVPEEQMFLHFEISECEIPEIGMRDYSHFNQIGAEAYCRFLGKKVRAVLDKHR